MIIHDQHVHSKYSPDSHQSLEGYLDLARERGVSYFITTEHVDLDYLVDGNDWNFDIGIRRAELNELQNKYPEIKMLEGIEIGYRSETQNRTMEILKNNHFDLVNLSIHESNRRDLYHPHAFKMYGAEKVLNDYFSTMLKAVEAYPDFDVLSHLDYGFKTAYCLDNTMRLSQFEETITKVLETLIARNKTLEINTKVEEFLPEEHTRYLLRLYKKLGGKHLTLSSDAHAADRFCSSFDKYIKIIKDEGFDHLCYFINRERKELAI